VARCPHAPRAGAGRAVTAWLEAALEDLFDYLEWLSWKQLIARIILLFFAMLGVVVMMAQMWWMPHVWIPIWVCVILIVLAINWWDK
jgi:hypothetical protein